MLTKLLKKKQEKRSALIEKAEKCQDVEELRGIQTEVENLSEEIRALEEGVGNQSPEPMGGDIATRTVAVTSEIPGIVADNMTSQENRGSSVDMEERINEIADQLRSGEEVIITSAEQHYIEERAIDSTGVLIEKKYSRNMHDGFNKTPQTIDLVDSFSLDGGNSYTVAIAIDEGNADYTLEGATYTNSEGTFAEVETGRIKITNSAIITEEVVNLPNIDYVSRALGNVKKSIRTKISKQIIEGTGGATQLKGIYNQDAVVMPPTYKIEVDVIDSTTLSKIVFGYGGDEDLEGEETLFLNKKDLEAFSTVMATDGRKYYEIEKRGTSGVIKEAVGGVAVNYTINSACKSIVDAVAGDKTMVYGDPMSYELPIFSPLKVKRSNERYIEQGKIGFFGSIIIGGVINKYMALMPIVKK